MASTYLTKSNSSTASTNQYKGTFSFWVKKSSGGYLFSQGDNTSSGSAIERVLFYMNSSGNLGGGYRGSGGSPDIDMLCSGKYRDCNGWYHIVYAYDTSLSTASERVRVYVNNVEQTVTWTGSASAVPQNTIFPLNKTSYSVPLYIGSSCAKFGYMDGVLSHFHFVDNQQYNASVFGSTDSTTGEWKINTSPTMTMGNMGFTVLKDGMTITDQSSNSNDFTLGGGTLTKTEDNPSNVFATLNPLFYSADITLSNGNTKAVEASNNWRSAYSNIGHSTGKFYAEAKITYQSGNEGYIGVAHEDHMNGTATYGGSTSGPNSGGYDYIGYSNKSVGIYSNGQDHYPSTVQKTASFQSSGDIIGIAVDIPGNKFYLSKNGQWNNAAGNAWDSTTFDASIGAISWTSKWTSGQVFVGCSPNESTWEWNFGNGYFGTTAVSSAGTNASGIGIFEYDVPSGFTAWSTKGLNE
jgi:hypothetical protein